MLVHSGFVQLNEIWNAAEKNLFSTLLNGEIWDSVVL